jgi:N-methylhydantoinase B
MKPLDAIDLGIAWDRLIAIADEVLQSVVRTAFSVGVREAWDLACILFDAQGRSIAQATLSMPAFIGTAPLTMQHMLQRFPAQTWSEGDVVVTNDPWLGTGHTPDLCIACPVFHRGRLVGFAMTISHLPDIGGAGLSVANTSLYQEGLILPVCRLHERGQPVAALHELIAANVRTPDLVFGDIGADIAGCVLAGRLVGEFLDESGLADLQALADGIVGQSEAAMRRAIAAIPDGEYRHRLEVETVDATVELACRITVAGDTLALDFDGTGPMAPHAINVPLCYTRAFASYAVKCLTVPGIPNNGGMLAPISVSAPAGCILNAQRPAPTGGRHTVGWFIVPLVTGALAQALPQRVQADSGMASLFICHTGRAGGEAGSTQYFLAGGLGGMQGLDGRHTTPSPTNNAVVATEIWENETGVRVEHRRLLPDSGGAGEFRGGLGQVAALKNTRDEPVTIFLFGLRTRFPAQGLLGGQPGAPRRFLVDGRQVPPKGRLELLPGQTFTVHEAGGGGWGDPLARDPQRVLADVQAGAVSVEGALRDYGVAVDLRTPTATRTTSR